MLQPTTSSTFEQELLLVIIEGLFIGTFIVLVGYFLNRQLERFKGTQELHRAEDRLRNETALKHLEAQIAELYGPLWGLLQYTQAINVIQQRRLQLADAAHDQNRKPTIEDHFRQAYFLPYNSTIAELIRTKTHLIVTEGVTDEIPESFVAFLQHQAQLETLTTLGKQTNVGSEGIEPLEFPPDFRNDVQTSLVRLRKEYAEYRRRLTDVR